MKRKGRPTGAARRVTRSPTALVAKFARVVTAFTSKPRVTYGGQGFGSRGLRVDGKIFAMLSTRDRFVVKLPRARVAELVQHGYADYFRPTGRPMKEWAAIRAERLAWLELAQEAYAFVASARDGV
jgi:TfoX/Sxy family transcriptional regulator of competence genes